ncbi:hypothetical protein TSUD_362690 [Trifolium subterraneum]|uniref:Reverse transcriptase domain-containing protein n=1 Tax=Trifolium subterraneum TaxID=3900 RepID=A0A2Z6P8N2_TRISU|nr:hypothetical protein TSUD_362690 [Trifolium subterraneum]
MNKNGAPGPDGFGAFFFQTFWDIVKVDVYNAVMKFFNTNWVMPGFNSNTVVLIPKVSDADTIGQFRPIAMANFKFKIISKILADRLALILPDIISKEQRGFIKGRQIKDCICLTSESINMLHHKSFGGNLAVKIDIAKAFDTIDWSFLLKVLKSFGFSDVFCHWISTILHSAKLSISINGKSEGFFDCSREVRLGDPLSPLFFCLAEDVLSRGLTKLVNDGHLKLIKGTITNNVPSHILYADYVMLFCKGTTANFKVLTYFFARYAQISGQFVNPQKSTIFVGVMSHARVHHIAQSLGFSVGTLPFIYLGVPIFKGKPKSIHFAPLLDKIKLKLAKWKASLLSYVGRVQLLKSVIQKLQLAFPQLLSHLQHISIPIDDKEDELIWCHTTYGELTMKDAYLFYSQPRPTLSWAKSLWNLAIPPSKSFMVWRLFHNKLPTDDNLAVRAISLPSMCSLCNKHLELSSHLFLECPFSLAIWQWFASIINLNMDFNSYSSLLNIINRGWNPQFKITVTAAVIFIINNIWLCRNNVRFNNLKPNMNSIISCITTSVSLAGNNTSLSLNSSIIDFEILKFFKINIHHSKAPRIIEVLWNPPLIGWYKCNTDGAAISFPNNAACSGIFRNHRGQLTGCFAQNLGPVNALHAEVMGVILAIECAYEKNWSHLWIETDSRLVTMAFKSPLIIPWSLKNRWFNCLSKPGY